MRQTQAAGAGCLLRALRAYVAFVVVSALVSVSAGYCASSRAVRGAEAAWAAAGRPMDGFAARFPAQPDSAAAKQLDALARPLGLQMVGRTPPSTPESKARGERLQAIGKPLGECGRSGSDLCPPPSADAQAFLREHSQRLDAIEALLTSGEPLQWQMDVAKGMASPFPHLLSHRYLQNLLLARVMLDAAQGRPSSERTLEASWVLNLALAERPELISRLVASAVFGMQHDVLRTLPRPPASWVARLAQPVFADALRDPFQLEAWNWTRYTQGRWGIFDVTYMEDGETPPPSLIGAAGRWLTAPYVRLSVAGMSKALLDESEKLASQHRCDLDVDRRSRDFEESFPRWNVLGRIATPSVVRSFAAFRYAELDRELTREVVAARTERAASGRWPAAAVDSGVCEGVRWLHEPQADGTLTIRASAEPFEPRDNRWSWSIRLHPWRAEDPSRGLPALTSRRRARARERPRRAPRRRPATRAQP
jgi:hypothetical protein